MKRGPFIVFEGADRSGKTTQTKRYADFLRSSGIPVADGVPWRFPDRTTEVGKMINAYLTNATNLDDQALHLLFSANRWEKASLIRDALAAGQAVIVDRYALSGVAYSTAKGLDFDWCKAPDAGLPAPDVVVYMDLSVDAARRRGDFGKERYENTKMQTAVAQVFSRLRTDRWRIVDADASQDTVFSRVLHAINDATDEAKLMEPVSTLW